MLPIFYHSVSIGKSSINIELQASLLYLCQLQLAIWLKSSFAEEFVVSQYTTSVSEMLFSSAALILA